MPMSPRFLSSCTTSPKRSSVTTPLNSYVAIIHDGTTRPRTVPTPIPPIRRSDSSVVGGKRGLALKPPRTAKITRVYAAANRELPLLRVSSRNVRETSVVALQRTCLRSLLPRCPLRVRPGADLRRDDQSGLSSCHPPKRQPRHASHAARFQDGLARASLVDHDKDSVSAHGTRTEPSCDSGHGRVRCEFISSAVGRASTQVPGVSLARECQSPAVGDYHSRLARSQRLGRRFDMYYYDFIATIAHPAAGHIHGR